MFSHDKTHIGLTSHIQHNFNSLPISSINQHVASSKLLYLIAKGSLALSSVCIITFSKKNYDIIHTYPTMYTSFLQSGCMHGHPAVKVIEDVSGLHEGLQVKGVEDGPYTTAYNIWTIELLTQTDLCTYKSFHIRPAFAGIGVGWVGLIYCIFPRPRYICYRFGLMFSVPDSFDEA